MNSHKTSIAFAALCISLLAGCGSGSSSNSSNSGSTGGGSTGGTSNTIPTGIYSGTGTISGHYSLNGATYSFYNTPTIVGIVTSSGNYELLSYSPASPNTVSQIDQGNATVSNSDFVALTDYGYGLASTFTPNNVATFPYQGSGSLAGNFTLNSSMTGVITYTTGSDVLTYTLNYAAASTTTAAVSNIAGTYNGNFYPNGTVSFTGISNAGTLTIAADGSITGTIACAGGYSTAATTFDPCLVSGTVTARGDVNAYNFSLTFANNTTGGQVPSQWAGKTFSGMGYYDAATKRFMLGIIASDGTAFGFSN